MVSTVLLMSDTDHPRWRRLLQRRSGEPDCLHEGVPEWLHESLLAWLRARFTVVTRRTLHGGSSSEVSRRLLQRYERECRNPLPWFDGGGTPPAALERLGRQLRREPDRFLEALDWAVRDHISTPSGGLDAVAKQLEDILSDGGSAWRVVPGPSGQAELQRRVGEELSALATTAIETSATDFLAKAWTVAFGLNPNASEAYRLAVLAVEGPLLALVKPKDERGTLGKALGELNCRQFKLAVAIDGDGVGADTVVAMLKLLWHNHNDRHARANPEAEVRISLEEARQAVHLATVLCQWLSDGTIGRG